MNRYGPMLADAREAAVESVRQALGYEPLSVGVVVAWADGGRQVGTAGQVDLGVQGYCPMGCGETLFRGDGGHVTCSWADCPDPGRADQVLGIAETEHVVQFEEASYTVQHPLRERVDELFDCELHTTIGSLEGPPVKPGRYRATKHSNDPTSESYRSDSIGWDFAEI